MRTRKLPFDMHRFATLRGMPNQSNTSLQRLPMLQVLLCGGMVVTLAMGIRHGFGLWLQPIIQDMGWSRESFSLAIAIQNLSWGIFGIFVGMVADRLGAFKVLISGSILYAIGLVGMALAPTTTWFAIFTGLVIGAAQAGTTYAVIYGVLGRQIPPERRSWAMGVTAAAGSFGQFFMVPVEGILISQFGWSQALLILAALALAICGVAFGLRDPGFAAGKTLPRDQTVRQALQEAWTNPSFVLLLLGYFVCGFQVMFIGVHMPSYLKDFDMPAHVASIGLALVGLFNIFGTYLAGNLGQKFPMHKRYVLSSIYGLRSVATILFLLAPMSAWSVYLFTAAMGFLWLSTVPLTNATIAQIFGVQHLSMLGGFVFFSHQVGSFLGVWLGGYLYDLHGNYDLVWHCSIGLGVLAAFINLPVKEAPLVRAKMLRTQ